MKQFLFCLCLLAVAKFPEANTSQFKQHSNLADTSSNIFIITVDGFRWQEIFGGPDSNIVKNAKFTHDGETITDLYGGGTAFENRKKLMPFLWSVIAKKGQILGNRNYENNVNVANPYAISYPGYNEIFTGTTDLFIATNKKKSNSHQNIFEYLNNKESYKGRVALFTSWDVFPFILNEKRTGIEINSGYENIQMDGENENIKKVNEIQTNLIETKEPTRNDMLTFIAAKEYLKKNRPKILFLGLGETDEYAHSNNYDMYLQKANETDKIIAELWHWVQTNEGYKNNTTFIITTDHGRGSSASHWMSHGPLTKGSSQTWMALLGKNVAPLGEVKTKNQLYQKQLAQTIAYFAGEKFGDQQGLTTDLVTK